MKKEMTGRIEILLATIIWGMAFVVIRDALTTVPFQMLMTWRYVLASAVMLLVFRRRLKKIDKDLILNGAVLGALLYGSQIFQTGALGFADTTAGKVGFISSLYVVLVPLTKWIWKRNGKGNLLPALLAVTGLLLLTLNGNLRIGKGDLVALIGSFGFAAHILAIDAFGKKHSAVELMTFQVLFAALYAGIVQLVSELVSGGAAQQVTWNPQMLLPIIYLGIFSTTFGFLLQFLGQQHLRPEAASVMLSMEAVFAMIFSVLFQGEQLSFRKIAGCILMFAALMLSGKNDNDKIGNSQGNHLNGEMHN